MRQLRYLLVLRLSVTRAETWRITKGNIDIVDGVGLSQGGFAAASGTQSIDLNGFEPGAFEVTVGFPAPGLYNLSFAVAQP